MAVRTIAGFGVGCAVCYLTAEHHLDGLTEAAGVHWAWGFAAGIGIMVVSVVGGLFGWWD